jgi:hypothetical protein
MNKNAFSFIAIVNALSSAFPRGKKSHLYLRGPSLFFFYSLTILKYVFSLFPMCRLLSTFAKRGGRWILRYRCLYFVVNLPICSHLSKYIAQSLRFFLSQRVAYRALFSFDFLGKFFEKWPNARRRLPIGRFLQFHADSHALNTPIHTPPISQTERESTGTM